MVLFNSKLFLFMTLVIVVRVAAVDETTGVGAVDLVAHDCIWRAFTLIGVRVETKVDETR